MPTQLASFLAVASAGALLCAPAASARPLDKLESQLSELAAGKPARARAGAATVQAVPLEVRGGRVRVDVYIDGAMRDGAAALRDEGMRVEAISGRSPQRMVEGSVPVSALDDIAALPLTKAVLPVRDPIFNTGSVNSQGDAVHRGPQVRGIGYDGTGIPVGIISDSMSRAGGGVAASQATGNLPADVRILQDAPSGSDEGRAMAEIVYDTVPGIPRILFSRGGGGAATRVNSIDRLVAAGAKVIADDVVYLDQPFFQDGIIAQAVDRAKANGTAYLVSAGNSARESWEGTFSPGSGGQNDFGGGDLRQTIATIPGGQDATIVLQWDDPFGASQSDFAIDFYKLPDETTPAFTVDTTDNVTTGLPVEGVDFTPSSTAAWSIGIRRVAGGGTNPTPRLKWLFNGPSTTPIPSEHSTASPAIDPDAASARGALAVAAVRHSDPGLNDPEPFSSRGPTVTRYFSPTGVRLGSPDVRPKPDVAGADGVATSVSGFNPFFGTSAAAPSAAGVAALILSARPTMSVDELYSILRSAPGSVDCTAAGFPDADCGYGFLLADGKLALVDSTAPAIAPVLSPAAPDGANGWYRAPVGVSWNVSDSGSVPVARSGCDQQTVTADGAFSATCTARSAGGSASAPVAFRRDGTPPTTPVISGIAPRAFSRTGLPAESAIGCTATDPTSAVDSCVVSGYSARRGAHTLTATATNGAGSASTATLAYSVKPLAIGGLKLPRTVKLATLLRAGVPVTANVATDATRLDATLKLGREVVGRLRKRVNSGRVTVRVKLTRSGTRRLAGRRGATLTAAVKATGSGADPVTRTRKFRARR